MAKNKVDFKIVISAIAKEQGLDKLSKKLAAVQGGGAGKRGGASGLAKVQKILRDNTKYGKKFNAILTDPKVQQATQKLAEAQKKYQDQLKKAQTVKSWKQMNADKAKALGVEMNKVAKEAKIAFNTKAIDGFAGSLGKAGPLVKQLSGALGEGAMASAALGPAAIAATMAIEFLGKAIQKVRQVLKNWINIKQWNKQLQGFTNNLKGLWNGLKNTVGAFRLIQQGILTMARSLTFFISAPLTLFLKNAYKAALDLETAMVRVAKVTGDMFKATGSIDAYTQELQNLAVVSISSIEQLAKFSEQLGQMGMRDPKNMLEMVAIMDVVAASTNMTADTIAQDLGAIANAYGMSLSSAGDQAVVFVDRVSEVINALENAAGVTGADVVNMLKDVGSTFSGLTHYIGKVDEATGEFVGTLQMNVGQVAGWATVAKELGMTADEVGTAMRNLPGYLNSNADAIDELGIVTDKFSNSMEFTVGLHQDFFGTVESLIGYLKDDEDAMNAVAASTELLGRRSGRLLQNLVKASKGTDRYTQIMEEAKKAWEEGGSLMEEYNHLLKSTGANIQMLKNGFENFAVTVGKDVLPKLNKLLGIAQAGALAFSDLFGALDAGLKKTIGKFVAFAALYGPVSWFFSQLFFGIGMVVQGMMRLGAFISPLIKLFGGLVGGLLRLNPVLIIIGGLLYKMFNQYTGGMEQIQKKTAQFFEGLQDNVGNWAKAVMDTFAGGIIAGAKTVIGALKGIGTVIADFLKAASPPKEGPLSDIDMWGAVLMNTWLKGFANADFGILSDVASKVEGILGSIYFTPDPDDDSKERKQVLKDLIKFREEFTRLLKDNRKGTRINEDYFNTLLAGYGSSVDEVRELIKAHLDLERIQRRLLAIEQERGEINQQYEDRVEAIRLSGKSAEEMVEAIASEAYTRDQNLGALSEEERLLKKREDMHKEQLEFQQNLLDALQEQSDLWKELLTLEKESGSGSKDEELMSGFGGTASGMEEVGNKLREAQLRFIELKIEAQKFKAVLFTIIHSFGAMYKVMTGTPVDEAMAEINQKVMDALRPEEWGKELAQGLEDIFGDVTDEATATEFITEYGDILARGLHTVMGRGEMQSFFKDWIKETIPNASDELATQLTDLFIGATDEVELRQITTSLPFEFEDLQNIPEDVPTTVTRIYESITQVPDTSATENMITNILPSLATIMTTFKDMFSDSGWIQGIRDFFTALGAGFGGAAPAGETLAPRKQNQMPWEEYETIEDRGGLSSLAYNIGELGRVLLEYGLPIADKLGKIAENILDFIAAQLGVAGAGEGAEGTLESVFEKFDKILDKVLEITEDIPAMESAILGMIFAIKPELGILLGMFKGLSRTTDIQTSTMDLPFDDDLKWWQKWGLSLAGTGTWGWQGGGWAFPGQVGRINEVGQELFSPPVAGKITSASLTQRMMHDVSIAQGGTGNNFSFTINNPTVRDDSDIDQLVDTIMYRIAQEVA